MTVRRSILPSSPSAAEAVTRLDRERQRLLSSSRLRLAFTLFVVALLLSLSGLIFVLVSSIFDTLTPSIRADLEWKARRGAQESPKGGGTGLSRNCRQHRQSSSGN